MPLAAGTRLGPYEIVAPLGEGGMGEVYRARDPRLNREVAIKTSREQFNERFEREARAVAAAQGAAEREVNSCLGATMRDMDSTIPKTLGASSGRTPKALAGPGLRSVQVWIPDLDEDTFRRQAHRQSLAVATSSHAKRDQDFIDAITIAPNTMAP